MQLLDKIRSTIVLIWSEAVCGRCFYKGSKVAIVCAAYKGGAGWACHAAADNSSHPVSQEGVRPVCLVVTRAGVFFVS